VARGCGAQKFDTCSKDELIRHALLALKGATLKGRLTSQNTSIAFVGKGVPFTVLEDDAVLPYVSQVRCSAPRKRWRAGGDAQSCRCRARTRPTM
jgi:hypothetical protein